MRKNENKVPEFDDIIFENRNKAYGGYDLRRRYKSTTTISVLGGIAISVLLTLILSLGSKKDASAGPGNVVFITVKPDNTLIQEKVKPAEPEKTIPEPVQNKYVPPVVVDDTSQISAPLPSIDDALRYVKNGSVIETDTIFSDPIMEIPEEPETYYSVEEMPLFPGGEAALLKFIAENTKYPSEAELNNIQGKVILKFAVEPDGSVARITVLRPAHPLLDEEAVRVIGSITGWKPGKQNGKPVPVWYIVPVNFQLRVDN